jgi:hypothetical protein
MTRVAPDFTNLASNFSDQERSSMVLTVLPDMEHKRMKDQSMSVDESINMTGLLAGELNIVKDLNLHDKLKHRRNWGL